MPFLMDQFYKPAVIEQQMQHQQDLHQVRQIEMQQAQQQRAMLAQRANLYQKVWSESPSDTTSVEGSPQWQNSMANQSQKYNKIAALLSKSGDYEGAKIAQEEGRKLSLSVENVQKRQEEVKAKRVEDAGTSASSFLATAEELKTPDAIQKEWTGEDGYGGKWAEFRDKGINLPRDITEAMPKLKGMQVASKQGLERVKVENKLKESNENRVAREQHWNEMAELRRESMRAAAIARETSGKTKLTGNERMVANTMNTAMAESAVGVENLMELTKGGTIHTTQGAFNNLSDHGVLGATAKSIGQRLTDTDKQMYRSIMLPLVRSNATVQSGGRYKITEAMVNQEIDAIIASSGQSHVTMLEKMAEIKQTLTAGAGAALDAGILNESQQKSTKESIRKISEAIPWSVKDVVNYYHSGGKGKDFGSWLKGKGSVGEYHIQMKGTLSSAQEKNLKSAREYAKKKGWSQEQLEHALKSEGFPL